MGRKRHIAVDTIGLLLAVVVHPADIQDRDGAKLVINKLVGRFPYLRLIWADAGYAGQLVDWVMSLSGWVLEIVRRPRDRHHFEVLPRRWVVERTLAWLGRSRRLSKDYEALTETTEAWVHIAMIHLMVRRLALHDTLWKHPLRFFTPLRFVQNDSAGVVFSSMASGPIVKYLPLSALDGRGLRACPEPAEG